MATITTINATDLVSASRAVINTNFSNLNTAKVDGATALTTAGRLVEVASSGVATQTSFASSVVVLTSGSYADPAWVTSLATTKLTGTLQAAQFPALTGDVTTSAGAVATTLANTAVTPASYGSATQVATFTVDSKGRLTAAASTSIAIAASQVTSGTLDNARTTAASTNTVSAIVARDASGNFAAGTITATFSGNLTGNVTGNVSGTAATITGALALANTPLTTRGDLLVATTATPILGRLAKGTQYQVLLGGATDPTWGAVDLAQASAITGLLPLGNGGTGATTLAGAGIVVGSASLTTVNAIPVVASAGTLGQSDATFVSGVLTRAGTVGLSATGSNVVTFRTNGSERGRFDASGNFGIGTTVPSDPLVIVGADDGTPILTLTNGLDGTTDFKFARNNTTGALSIQGAQVGNNNIILAPTSGNLLVGTTTDDGVSKLQVAGAVKISGQDDSYLFKIMGVTSGIRYRSNETTHGNMLESVTLAENAYYPLTFAATRFNFIGGRVSIGTTETVFGLDVATSGATGTMRVYDQTATTGVSTLVVRAGAGQSTTALQTWQNNAGTAVLNIDPTGVILMPANSTNYAVLQAMSGGADNGNYGLYFNHTDQSVIMYAGTTNVLEARKNKIGFFGVTPVARAAALTAADATALNTGDAGSDTVIGNIRTRLGELETKLQAYGLLN